MKLHIKTKMFTVHILLFDHMISIHEMTTDAELKVSPALV